MKHNGIQKSPLVSVIIPCYNSADTLLETIQSVQRQSFTDWEIIIVNDGSRDHSVQLVNQLALETNITVIHQSNSGVSSARNKGVQAAQGEYLAFLDADDIWHEQKLKIQVNCFEQHQNIGICYSKVRFTSPSGKSLEQYSAVSKKPLTAIDLLLENHLCTSSNIMCRKRVFIENGGFDSSMNYAEDQEWLVRVALNGQWDITGVDDVLLDYRTQTDSLSSSLEKMEQGWQTLTHKIHNYAPQFINSHYHRAQAIYLRYLARRALRQGEPALIGLQFIKRAIASDWRIFILSPRRSFGTLAGLLCWWSLPTNYAAHILHINKQ